MDEAAEQRSAPTGRAVVVAITLLIAAEAALQVRSQLRTGQSVLTALTRGPTYVVDEEVGAKLLRPNSTIDGATMHLVSNRYGLRGADFEPAPEPGETRIALLGASTVMGLYSSTGETSSEQLELLLADRPAARRVRVINAGIEGLPIDAQERLFERRVCELRPTLVFWYPGANDISCAPIGTARRSATSRAPLRLPAPSLPSWVITTEILVQNSAILRERPGVADRDLAPSFDLARLRAIVRDGAAAAARSGIRLALVTLAHAYRSEMSDAELASAAQSALFFRPCLTARELATQVDELNAMLRDEARALELPLVDAAAELPPDPELFADASHFSAAGERRFAELLAREADRLGL